MSGLFFGIIFRTFFARKKLHTHTHIHVRVHTDKHTKGGTRSHIRQRTGKIHVHITTKTGLEGCWAESRWGLQPSVGGGEVREGKD